MIFEGTKENYDACDVFHRFCKPSIRDEMKFSPQVKLQPFDKWSIDFIGPINPPAHRSNVRYIIMAID